MPLILTQAQAVRTARAYAGNYDVPWVGIVRVRAFWEWCPFTPDGYRFDIDTGGEGCAVTAVDLPFKGVVQFEFRPSNPTRFWLPPWAAYPRYTSITMNWRQGEGEVYLTDWYRWYETLTGSLKVAYREHFPEPQRGGWPGFYDWGK